MMTTNYYCACCLRTQTFVANERGYQCQVCRRVLLRADPPRRITREAAVVRSAAVLAPAI